MPRILESDALALARNIDSLPEDQRPQAASILQQYKEQQEAEGLPHWPQLMADQEQETKRFRSMFESLSNVDGAAPAIAPVVKYAADPDEHRARVASTAFLATRYGKPADEVANAWELYAGDYAAKTWNEATPLDSKRFYARAKVEIQGEIDREDLTNSLGEAVTKAALLNDKTAWQAWKDSAVTHPGWKPELEGQLFEAWRAADTKIKADMGENAALIRRTVESLQSKTGVEGNAAEWTRPEYDLRELLINDPAGYKKTLRLIGRVATVAAKDNKEGVLGWFQKAGESLARSVEGIGEGFVADAQRGASAVAGVVGAEDTAKLNDASVRVARDLRDIANGVVDPVKRNNWFDTMIFGGLESAPSMVAGMAGPLNAGLVLKGQYAGDAEKAFEEHGWTGAGSKAAAQAVGVVAAAVESMSEMFGATKWGKAAMKAIGAGPESKFATRYFINSTLRGVSEFSEEVVQDNLAAATQSMLNAVGLSVGAPAPFMEEVSGWVKTQGADTALIVLPLALLGAGLTTSQEIGQAKTNAMLSDVAQVAKMVGQEAAARITAISDPAARAEAFQQAYQSQTSANRQEWLTASAELEKAKAELARATEADAEKSAISVTHDADGWSVNMGEGGVVRVDSAQAAVAIRNDLMQASTEDEARALVSVVEDWHKAAPEGTTRQTTFTGEQVRLGGDGQLIGERAGGDVRVIDNPKLLADIRSQAQSTGLGQEIDLVVNGSNSVFAHSVNEATRQIVQRLEINRSDAQAPVITVLHEQLEANLKAANLGGVVSAEETMNALSHVADALPVADAQQRLAALERRKAPQAHIEEARREVDLRQRIQAIANGEGDEAAMREIAVELAVADVIARDRSGQRTGFRAGAVSAALDSAIERAVTPGEVRALGKFRAFLRSVRAWVRSVLGTVAGFQKAKRDGKLTDGDAWNAWLDKVTGVTEQSKYDQDLAAEIAASNADGLSYNPGADAFSLSRATPADVSNVVEMPDGALLVGPTTFSITAYHGTPHKVDRFSLDKIGTGEGAQAYGWGLYFAEKKSVAKNYQKGLTERDFIRKVKEVFIEFDSSDEAINALNELDLSEGQRKLVDALREEDWWGFDYPHQAVQSALREPENFDPGEAVLDALKSFGNLYTVELLPDESEFLDWDKPLSEQSEKVQNAIRELLDVYKDVAPNDFKNYLDGAPAASWYVQFMPSGSPEKVSRDLLAAGIPGVKYLDAGSRGAGDGSRNFVIFDEKLVKILEENGKPVDTSARSFSLSAMNKADQAAQNNSSSPGGLNEAEEVTSGIDELRQRVSRDEWIRLHGYTSVADEVRSQARSRPPNFSGFNGGDEYSGNGWANGRRMSNNAAARVDAGWLMGNKELAAWAAEQLGLPERAVTSKIVGRAATDSGNHYPEYHHIKDAKGNVITENFWNPEEMAVQPKFWMALAKWLPAKGHQAKAKARALQAFQQVRQDLMDRGALGQWDFGDKATSGGGILNGLPSALKQGVLERQITIQEAVKHGYEETASLMEKQIVHALNGPEGAIKHYQNAKAKADSKPEHTGWQAKAEAALQRVNGVRSKVEAEFAERLKFYKDAASKMGIRLSTDALESSAKPEVPGAPTRAEDVRVTDRATGATSGTNAHNTTQFTDSVNSFNSPAPTDGADSFSISAARNLELVQSAVDQRLARDPDKRLTLAAKAKQKLDGLRKRWSEDGWTALGHYQRPLVEKRSKSSLDKEQAMRQAQALDRILAEKGYTSADAARSKDSKDYEAWQRFHESRDILLKNGMSDDEANLLAGSSASTWRNNLVSAVRDALTEAKTEAQAWRDDHDAKQAKDWNPRAALVRDLQLLDSVLSVLPPEVRGKVGGFVKLAQLATEDARVNELRRRVSRMDTLLEDYLAKEYRERIDNLLEKASPKMKPGEKPKGSMAADAHRMVKLVREAMAVSEDAMDERRAALEKAMAEDAANMPDLLERAQVLELFGGFDKLPASELAVAHDWLADVVASGRNRWKMVEEARLAEQKARATQLKDDTGKSGDPVELQNAIEAEKTLAKTGVGLGFSLISFPQTVRSLFGDKSEVGQRLIDMARRATSARTDAIIQRRAEFKDAMREIFGTKDQAKIDEALWEHSQVTGKLGVTVKWSELTTKSERVPRDVVERMMQDRSKAKALGFTTNEVDELERAWLDPENDGKSIFVLDRMTEGPAKDLNLSQMQAIHLLMMATQKPEALARHGYTADVLDEIEGKLTDEAKRIRAWLLGRYRDGYQPLNAVFQRMYGAPLPQISGYSPLTFEGMQDGGILTPEGGSQGFGGMSPGALKTRRNHNAKPRLEDALAVYWSHAIQTEHFTHFAEAVRDMRATLLQPDTRAAIQVKAGVEGLNALKNWVHIFENDGMRKAGALTAIEKLSSKLQSAFSISALAWNVGTMVKQSLAALGALYKMPTRAYLRGLSRVLSGKIDIRPMWKSTIIRRRVEAGATPELRQVMAGYMAEHPGKWSRRPREFVNYGMELIGKTDGFFTAISAAIYHDHISNEMKASGMGEAEASALAMRETEAMIGDTAQPVELMDRSLFEAGNAASPNARWLFMFASEVRQKTALYGVALHRIATGRGTKQDARVVLVSHVIAPLILQTITNIIRDARSDDDDEAFDMETWSPMRYLQAMAMGPLSGLPLIQEVSNPMLDMIQRSYYGIEGLFDDKKDAEPIEKGTKAAKAALNAVSLASIFPGLKPLEWLGSGANGVGQLFDWLDNLQGKDKKGGK